jgi:hypothetical protein
MTHLMTVSPTVAVSYFTPSISGNPATNDYATLTVGNVNQIGVTGSGTSTLSLPAGRYHIRCCLGGTKSTASSDLQYQLELGGSLAGNLGGWDTNNGLSPGGRASTEYSEHVVVLTTATNLRVKVTLASGTNAVTSTYSGMIIRRVS